MTPNRIQARLDASEDGGASWRKDFDLTFDREINPGSTQRVNVDHVASLHEELFDTG